MEALAPVGFAAELRAHAERRGPVTIGLVGAGQMGTDMIVQVRLMAGLVIGAVCDSDPQVVRDAAALAGLGADEMTVAADGSAVDRAIEEGRLAIAEDYRALCAAGRIDVIIDATGSPNTGALVALDAIRHGKHVVMLNVEADITVGRLLRAEAKKAGVVYTGAAGDEPAATLELIGFAQSLGLEIVAAGKGKNNPLKFDAVPEDFESEAKARKMSSRMLVEFVDGTKTMVEMTAVANATGLVPDVPGMHGPAAAREELAQVLCTKADGGILSRSGVVDYSIGKGVAPGVFCIVKPRHPRVAERMIDLKVGRGPCFLLFRPYHLTSLETLLSAARAVLWRQADLAPLGHPVAECAALAKRDLQPGEILGKIGAHDYRGFAMRWEEARQDRAVPLGLAEGARVTRLVRAGEKLTADNCAPDDTLPIIRLRQQLDATDDRLQGG